MLTCGRCVEVDGVDDTEEFNMLHDALVTNSLDNEELDGLYQTLAALLHLGNSEFTDKGENEQCDFVANGLPAENLAELLGLDTDAMSKALTVRHSRSGRGSYVAVNLTAQQAEQNCHALIKHVYGSLFAWLVKKINVNGGNSVTSSCTDFIGILDIFGFEIMQHNRYLPSERGVRTPAGPPWDPSNTP